jgi:hypothetical protein
MVVVDFIQSPLVVHKCQLITLYKKITYLKVLFNQIMSIEECNIIKFGARESDTALSIGHKHHECHQIHHGRSSDYKVTAMTEFCISFQEGDGDIRISVSPFDIERKHFMFPFDGLEDTLGLVSYF